MKNVVLFYILYRNPGETYCACAVCRLPLRVLLSHAMVRLEKNLDVDTGKAQVQCYSEGHCPNGQPTLNIGQFDAAKECCIIGEALSWQSGGEPCAACLSTWLYTPQYVACAILCPCFQKMISSELRFPFPLTISTLILWHSLIHALFRDLVSVYYTDFIMQINGRTRHFWCVLLL